MIYNCTDSARRTAFAVADLMVTAAKTAPKGCGLDNLEAIILDGVEKDELANLMRAISEETGAEFFKRDAENVENSHCVVVIGCYDSPIGLENCGICGFENCAATIKAGGRCAFNITDLGIAVGSAVSVAADNRIDNRVMFSAGKAALRMKCFPPNVKVCYGIPLSTSSKSIFFDRGLPSAALAQQE